MEVQICPKCGAQIKYIATGYDTGAMCESMPLEVINSNGHKFKGYPFHKCKEDIKASEQNNARNE